MKVLTTDEMLNLKEDVLACIKNVEGVFCASHIAKELWKKKKYKKLSLIDVAAVINELTNLGMLYDPSEWDEKLQIDKDSPCDFCPMCGSNDIRGIGYNDINNLQCEDMVCGQCDWHYVVVVKEQGKFKIYKRIDREQCAVCKRHDETWELPICGVREYRTIHQNFNMVWIEFKWFVGDLFLWLPERIERWWREKHEKK